MIKIAHDKHGCVSVKEAYLPSNLREQGMEESIATAVEKATIDNSRAGFENHVSASVTYLGGGRIFVSVLSV